jgi:1,4-alpha-glucan branching enzyme
VPSETPGEASTGVSSTSTIIRTAKEPPVLVASGITPEPRQDYRVGLPQPAQWQEVLNTDATYFRGSGMDCGGEVVSKMVPWHERPCSVVMTLPPLSTLFFVANGEQAT